MAQVSGGDLRRVFAFMQSAIAGTRDDPLPSATLAALRQLIPAELIVYFELRRTDRAVLAVATSDTYDPNEDEEALLAFGHQNPLSWRRWGPGDGALRLSASIRRRELEQLEYYQSVMVPTRIRDSLKIWLWSTAESVACVGLDRSDSYFTRRDQDLLGILQHHLIALREQALSGSLPPTADSVWLTAREAEVLTWAARGLANDDVAKVLGTSSTTVGKHLENAYAKLGVHSRAEALGLVMLSAPRNSGRSRPS